MKPEIKAEWIAALRSGEYEQGTRNLRNGDRFCCLGVLCDLASKHGMGNWNTSGTFIIGGVYENNLLPSEIVEWAGLTLRNPRVGPIFDDEWRYGLADWNDGVSESMNPITPRTFAEIADLIEKDL